MWWCRNVQSNKKCQHKLNVKSFVLGQIIGWKSNKALERRSPTAAQQTQNHVQVQTGVAISLNNGAVWWMWWEFDNQPRLAVKREVFTNRSKQNKTTTACLHRGWVGKCGLQACCLMLLATAVISCEITLIVWMEFALKQKTQRSSKIVSGTLGVLTLQTGASLPRWFFVVCQRGYFKGDHCLHH